MTILEIIQEACDELAIKRPTAAVNSTELQTRQLVGFAREELRALRREYEWVELLKDGSISLVAGQATYALPADFDRWVSDSMWDSNGLWTVDGPVTPQEWQEWKHGIVNSSFRRRFRIRGYGASQISLDPTPATGDTGQILTFEYVSKTVILPRAWATGILASSGSYISYNGNIYICTSGGVTGSTAPTHTSGTVSDGGASWTYSSATYDTFRADTDEPILDNEVVKKGIKWRFKQKSGLSVDAEKAEYMIAVKQAYCAKKGAQTLNMGGTERKFLIDESNYPEKDYAS